MIYIDKNTDAVIIVIHEIYGINQHIKDFCNALSQHNFDVGFTDASQKVRHLLADIKDQYKKCLSWDSV